MEAANPLDSFLKEAQSERRKCKVCACEQARKILADFCARKAKGDQSVAGVSLLYLVDNLIVGKLNLPTGRYACYSHVKQCLKVDRDTGRPLDPA